MLDHELNQAIETIEKSAEKKYSVELTPHRWGQVLRILKFYKLREDSLEKDPAWEWRQDHPISPYYINHMKNHHKELAKYYAENPDRCIEPPKELEYGV